MAKSNENEETMGEIASSPVISPLRIYFQTRFLEAQVPLLLALVTFLVYLPSLRSDFVYDAHREILEEGFITSLANLPAVLSLKVLGMNLMLAGRPGTLLYLMGNAAIWGKHPWGYHLCSNLLHAVNVALVFVLLRRLIAPEMMALAERDRRKVQMAMIVVTLIFALHPLAVETVAAVNYSSDLLVAFFTLGALLAATMFQPGNFRAVMIAGTTGTLCALAAVMSKESGAASVSILLVYWVLFRRGEAKGPWFLFLGASIFMTVVFLAARFDFALSSARHPDYLGGSLAQVFLIQPRLWVFMMGQGLWPMHLSADYTLENIEGITTAFAVVILIVVVGLQGWLAAKSRVGALGVAVYWLGLLPVSNFVPLYRMEGDRFYYLPAVGMALQLLALLVMTLKGRWGFWMVMAPLLVALLPLTGLTVIRQGVFADNLSLWSDTIRVSPFSPTAHNDLGWSLAQTGKMDEATVEYRKALEIEPTYAEAHVNLGMALARKGEVDEAMNQFQEAVKDDPELAEARYNLGLALVRKGQVDEAALQYGKALEINPNYAKAHYNLGNVFLKKGETEEAMGQYREALRIDPGYAEAHVNLGIALSLKGRMDEAISEFQEVVRLEPDNRNAQINLAKAQAMMGQKAGER